MITVVVPAYNEAELLESAVGQLIERLRARNDEFEVVVVENGSADDTAAIAKALAASIPEVRALSLPHADYGGALYAGLQAATGDVVINFDADYVDVAFLDDAVGVIRGDEGPDIVVGSKRAAGSTDRRSPLRRVVTASFALVLRVAFGLHVSDTHGMKAMRRSAVAPLADECRLRADLFDTELIIRAERAGLRVAEVPVVVEELRPPRTSIVRRGMRTVVGLARLWRAVRRG